MRRLVNKIMDEFDFERVHKVMTFLNWSWYHTSGVPTLSETKEFARNLLEEAVREFKENKIQGRGSGGFEVNVDKGYLELSFVLSSWSEEKEL